jgi:hypothetical protein
MNTTNDFPSQYTILTDAQLKEIELCHASGCVISVMDKVPQLIAMARKLNSFLNHQYKSVMETCIHHSDEERKHAGCAVCTKKESDMIIEQITGLAQCMDAYLKLKPIGVIKKDYEKVS